jgi:hypothetical protein
MEMALPDIMSAHALVSSRANSVGKWVSANNILSSAVTVMKIAYLEGHLRRCILYFLFILDDHFEYPKPSPYI